jgi:hypothetical protein
MTTPAAAKSPSSFGRMLESPRAQRRALIVGVVVLVAGLLAFTFAFFRNTGHPLPDVLSNQAASVNKNEPTVPLDPALEPLMKQFIATAVVRKNLDAAFAITGPDLRGNLTRKQFETGNIPVVPYPAADIQHIQYTVEYSNPTQAELLVGLNPTADSKGTRVLSFFIGFKKFGSGSAAHWVVNYWEPDYHPPVPKGPN